jgi:multidrug resistance efflux pump
MPNKRRMIFIAVLVVVLGFLATLGYRYWYQPTYDFFYTDDARISGSLVRVVAPAAGQISEVFFDVGTTVKRNDALATVKVVSAAPSVANAPSVSRVLARVTSPIDGTVASRGVNVGDTVVPGQAVATIVDLTSLWIAANVDEARAPEIRPGLAVDVNIPAVDHTFSGAVREVSSATTDVTTASSPISLGSSADTAKKVAVKIVFDYAGYQLVPGMSANITIYTRDAAK